MHELYSLKETLCENLKEFGKKSEISGQTLEIVDKLAHAIKNIDKIIEKYEESEGMSMAGGSYRGSYDGSYEGRGRSNARGRRSNMEGPWYDGSNARGRGSNARRDSRGRYSSDGYSGNEEMLTDLRELMQDAPDEKTRMEFQRFISKIESM